MLQQQRTLQEIRTTLAPAEVIARAKQFFTRRNSIYATFPEQEGPGYITFRGMGGEELAIGATPVDGGSRVTGSTLMFDMQIARFFTTLPPFPAAEQELPLAEVGPGPTNVSPGEDRR